jgi:hypothetical protein
MANVHNISDASFNVHFIKAPFMIFQQINILIHQQYMHQYKITYSMWHNHNILTFMFL